MKESVLASRGQQGNVSDSCRLESSSYKQQLTDRLISEPFSCQVVESLTQHSSLSSCQPSLLKLRAPEDLCQDLGWGVQVPALLERGSQVHYQQTEQVK